jgi:hypothetical protein
VSAKSLSGSLFSRSKTTIFAMFNPDADMPEGKALKKHHVRAL